MKNLVKLSLIIVTAIFISCECPNTEQCKKDFNSGTSFSEKTEINVVMPDGTKLIFLVDKYDFNYKQDSIFKDIVKKSCFEAASKVSTEQFFPKEFQKRVESQLN